MSVAGRISRVEAFTGRMIKQRYTTVRLMMWEICKPLAECRVEFERAVEYNRDTVDALKDLDRASSRFVIEKRGLCTEKTTLILFKHLIYYAILSSLKGGRHGYSAEGTSVG